MKSSETPEILRPVLWDFPSDPVVKNSIHLSMQGTQVRLLVPKMPHYMEQLSPCATTSTNNLVLIACISEQEVTTTRNPCTASRK